MSLKVRFPLWPLRPLAFGWTIDSMIRAILISWLVKGLMLRHGRLRAHRRALPLFSGLIVGDGAISLTQTVMLQALRGE
jgi:hypothetical protein